MKTFEKTTTLTGVLDYNNLTDPRTMEYGVSYELTEIAKELDSLVEKVKLFDYSMVGKMKRGAITWEELNEQLGDLFQQILNTTSFVLEKFD